jgi:hypothetical protein
MNVTKLNCPNQKLDYQKKTFGRLQHRATLGVASYHATCKKYAGIDSDISKAKHTIGVV